MSEEYEEFEDELDDKELIMCVKAKSFLYNKSEKHYSNIEIKNMAWDSIGNTLTKRKTGAETEHRFYQLRQRFGRERRKVLQSQPRSGAGTNQPTYTSQWSLYNDLMFLADVIKHRKTTSNYTKKKHPTSQVKQVNLPTTSLNQTSISSSSSISSLWNEELNVNLPEDVPEYSNMSQFSSTSPTIRSQESSLSVQSVASSSFVSDSNKISPLEQTKETNNSYEKRVPESDIFAKRKLRDVNNFSKSISEQSQALNALAQKVGDALVACGPTQIPLSVPNDKESFSSLRPDVKAMLNVIAFSLEKIPESKQLDFLITIIQLIKQHTEND